MHNLNEGKSKEKGGAPSLVLPPFLKNYLHLFLKRKCLYYYIIILLII